ncbi:TPA: hypothetical protein ACG3KG_001012 [Clostridioides difficile]|nr:hypothetical protein [Clostridioides difficile]
MVFETFDKAIELYPNAKPIFHSDIGFRLDDESFEEYLGIVFRKRCKGI